MQTTITEKINELVKKAPHNWVIIVSNEMGKRPNSIYAYASGSRGTRYIHLRLKVHEILSRIVSEHEQHVKKLIA
jgi:hypothetical protein